MSIVPIPRSRIYFEPEPEELNHMVSEAKTALWCDEIGVERIVIVGEMHEGLYKGKMGKCDETGTFHPLRDVVVKTAKPSEKPLVCEENRAELCREIAHYSLLEWAKVPHLLKVEAKGVWHRNHEHGSASVPFLALEYVKGKDGFDYTIDHPHGVELAKARRIARDVLSSIASFPFGFYWLDPKLENILVDSDDRVKIFDFGLSVYAPSTRDLYNRDPWSLFYYHPHKAVGTIAYIAPELMTDSRPYYSSKMDSWSFGCMLVALLTNQFMFDPRVSPFLKEVKSTLGRACLSKDERVAKVPDPFADLQAKADLRGREESERMKKVFPLLQDLFRRSIFTDPESRKTPQELLRHPFFRDPSPESPLSLAITPQAAAGASFASDAQSPSQSATPCNPV